MEIDFEDITNVKGRHQQSETSIEAFDERWHSSVFWLYTFFRKSYPSDLVHFHALFPDLRTCISNFTLGRSRKRLLLKEMKSKQT